MRTLSSADAAHVLQSTTTWAVCCRVSKRDEEVVRLTNHDRDLEVVTSPDVLDLSGTYERFNAISETKVVGNADLSVDNLEVDALLEDMGITRQQIRAGIFDDVEYVFFIVNWRDTADSLIIIKRGVVGNVKDFLNDMATFELRGFKQYLQQTITQAAGPTCRYILGDERCGVNLDSFTYLGEVTEILVQRRSIGSIITGAGSPEPPDPTDNWFRGGLLTWQTGSNAGLSIEIKTDAGDGDLSFFEPIPYDIQVGDTFNITPGCDHQHTVVDGVATGDCKNKFDKVINFGGEPLMPSQDSLIEAVD